MSSPSYRYQFGLDVPMEDVEASLVLALLGAEALHGETQVQLSASHFLDIEGRECLLESGNQVADDLNRLFAGLVRREFGPDSVQISRMDDAQRAAAPAA